MSGFKVKTVTWASYRHWFGSYKGAGNIRIAARCETWQHSLDQLEDDFFVDHDCTQQYGAFYVSSWILLTTIFFLEFLEAIRSVNPPGKWKVLVVDDHSQRLLGAVLSQLDILSENVTCTAKSDTKGGPRSLITTTPAHSNWIYYKYTRATGIRGPIPAHAHNAECEPNYQGFHES